MVYSWLKQWGSTWLTASVQERRSVRPTVRPGVESLEMRDLPSAAPASLAISIQDGSGHTIKTATAGTPISVVVTARDSSGHTLTNDNDTVTLATTNLRSSAFFVEDPQAHNSEKLATHRLKNGTWTFHLTPLHSDAVVGLNGVSFAVTEQVGQKWIEGRSATLTINPASYTWTIEMEVVLSGNACLVQDYTFTTTTDTPQDEASVHAQAYTLYKLALLDSVVWGGSNPNRWTAPAFNNPTPDFYVFGYDSVAPTN